MGLISADNLAIHEANDTGHANKAIGLAHHFENLVLPLNNFI